MQYIYDCFLLFEVKWLCLSWRLCFLFWKCEIQALQLRMMRDINQSNILSAPVLSCLSSAAVRCSWERSTSEVWETCLALTVPVAVRCPTLPWCLGTASTGVCSTQSTCWHTAVLSIVCCWRVTWVETEISLTEWWFARRQCILFWYIVWLCLCFDPKSKTLFQDMCNAKFWFPLSPSSPPTWICFFAWEKNSQKHVGSEEESFSPDPNL